MDCHFASLDRRSLTFFFAQRQEKLADVAAGKHEEARFATLLAIARPSRVIVTTICSSAPYPSACHMAQAASARALAQPP
jgi:hypothetical protein